MSGVAVVKKPRLRKFRKSNVNLSKVILAVRAEAAAHPDRVYAPPSGAGGACMYAPSRQSDGTMSGCIIGQALRATGVSTSGCEDVGIGNLCTNRLSLSAEGDRRVGWLQQVQFRQDQGSTWSHAVAEADRLHPLA